MHYKPIIRNRKELQADSLNRQKCYTAYLRSLLAKESVTNTATDTIIRRGAK